MDFLEIMLLAIALSMDAFAVSVACAIAAPKLSLKSALTVAGAFGFFQAAMPIIGWNVGTLAYEQIKAFDHWVAFGMLAAVGSKMVWDAFRTESYDGDGKCFAYPRMDYKILLLLAVATSLDAFAVGVSFSCLNRPIVFPSALIGVVTFTVSLLGIKFGGGIGRGHDAKFTAIGGIVLLLIGVKILITG